MWSDDRKYNDIKVGDRIEAYVMEEVPTNSI